MRRAPHITFSGELDVVKSLSGRAIDASIAELKSQEELTKAIRAAVSLGVSIDEISAETGLTPEQIRSRLDRRLLFSEDIAVLSGDLR